MTTIPARDFRCGTEPYRAPSSRPSRADLQRPDYALLAAYTAGVQRAVEANRGREAREARVDGLYRRWTV